MGRLLWGRWQLFLSLTTDNGQRTTGKSRSETMRVHSTGSRVSVRLVMLAMACAGTSHGPVVAGSPTGSGAAVDMAAAERGRVALTLKGFLKPEWSGRAYENVARLWDQPAPDPDHDPQGLCGRVPQSLWLASGPFSQRWIAAGPAAGHWPGWCQKRHANRLHGLSRRIDRRPELCWPW